MTCRYRTLDLGSFKSACAQQIPDLFVFQANLGSLVESRAEIEQLRSIPAFPALSMSFWNLNVCCLEVSSHSSLMTPQRLTGESANSRPELCRMWGLQSNFSPPETSVEADCRDCHFSELFQDRAGNHAAANQRAQGLYLLLNHHHADQPYRAKCPAMASFSTQQRPLKTNFLICQWASCNLVFLASEPNCWTLSCQKQLSMADDVKQAEVAAVHNSSAPSMLRGSFPLAWEIRKRVAKLWPPKPLVFWLGRFGPTKRRSTS